MVGLLDSGKGRGPFGIEQPVGQLVESSGECGLVIGHYDGGAGGVFDCGNRGHLRYQRGFCPRAQSSRFGREA